MNLKKKIEDLYLNILLNLSKFYIKKRRVNTIFKRIKNIEENYTRSLNYEKAFSIILKKKVNYLDIGAREGPDDKLKIYKKFFSIILCEPEINEAKKLKKIGYIVIDKIISEKSGKKDFYVTKDPMKSSTLQTGGSMEKYFCRDEGLEKCKIKKKIKIMSITMDQIEKKIKSQIHYLKLDTQGSEYKILDSMKKSCPIFIKTEVSCAELYKNQHLLYDIGKLLYKKGYIMFRNNILNRNVPFSKNFSNLNIPPSIGLPLHGDVYFMPDWTRKVGKKIIKRNELHWAAIMLFEGQQQLLMYINSIIKLKNRKKINNVISIL